MNPREYQPAEFIPKPDSLRDVRKKLREYELNKKLAKAKAALARLVKPQEP